MIPDNSFTDTPCEDRGDHRPSPSCPRFGACRICSQMSSGDNSIDEAPIVEEFLDGYNWLIRNFFFTARVYEERYCVSME
jgi:hypothetical protein